MVLGLVAGLPVFRKALAAVDGPSLGWLEGDLALFSTVRTDGFCHFPGPETAGASVVPLVFHCFACAVIENCT